MKLYFVLIIICLISCHTQGQEVSEYDSAFIYKHFLFYDSETKSFDDIDEPFIEEYWKTEKEKAKKYYQLASYLKSIPVAQRVIMISYLDEKEKMKAHQWIYDNLQTSSDTTSYFKILRTGYGLPYSKLKIPESIVKSYCSNCNYK